MSDDMAWRVKQSAKAHEIPFPVDPYEPLTPLRWNGGVLEQLWKDNESGALEWHPVPHADEDAKSE